jgi:hypothetical protein
MLHPKTYSKEYGRGREQLIRSRDMHVAIVEDEIAADPDPRREGRYERDGYCYRTKVPEVLIKYQILESGWVRFLELIDVSSPDLAGFPDF